MERRIHIIEHVDSQGQKEAAAEFNRLHPKRMPITQTSVRRLMTKTRDKEEHREHPQRCTDESTSFSILFQTDVNLRSLRWMSTKIRFSTITAIKNFAEPKVAPV
jgi:tRNA(Glu) U13 pseudouridine synthase TruD